MATGILILRKVVEVGGGGGVNFRHDVESGTKLGSALKTTMVQASGSSAAQCPATLTTAQASGSSVSQVASGTATAEQISGTKTTTVMNQIGNPLAVCGSEIQSISYVGTVKRWVATATNIGADNWNSITDAQGASDSSSATRSGQTLSATDAELRLQFDLIEKKDALNIDGVKLHFYVSQSGTGLNNGGLSLDWRIGSSGPWTTLATYTNNQNFMTTPDTYDISSSISSWADISAVEARVRCNLGGATALVSCAVDAVQLHINTSLEE